MPRKPPQRQAPGPLLAVMGTMIVLFLGMAFVTQSWVFLILGLFGLLAGLVPFISR